MLKLKSISTVSGVGVTKLADVVGDFDMWFKPDGVVVELRIVVGEFVKNGLVVEVLDGSDDGEIGDTERLRVGNTRFFMGCKNDVVGDFGVVSFDSEGILVRGCLDKEDIRRLAAAIGPIDKHSVNELVLFSLWFVDSSLEDNSSLLDILNKFILLITKATKQNAKNIIKEKQPDNKKDAEYISVIASLY